jgi:hypothetical protein
MSAELIEEVFLSRLTSGGEVVALIGSRIYPGFAPQNETRSYLAWSLVGTVDDMETMESIGNSPERATYEFVCVGLDGLESARIAKALRARLNGFSGVVGNVRIMNTTRDAQRGNSDIPNQRYWISAVYTFAAQYL